MLYIYVYIACCEGRAWLAFANLELALYITYNLPCLARRRYRQIQAQIQADAGAYICLYLRLYLPVSELAWYITYNLPASLR